MTQQAQVEQHCPDGSAGTIQTINGRRFLVCPQPKAN